MTDKQLYLFDYIRLLLSLVVLLVSLKNLYIMYHTPQVTKYYIPSYGKPQ